MCFRFNNICSNGKIIVMWGDEWTRICTQQTEAPGTPTTKCYGFSRGHAPCSSPQHENSCGSSCSSSLASTFPARDSSCSSYLASSFSSPRFLQQFLPRLVVPARDSSCSPFLASSSRTPTSLHTTSPWTPIFPEPLLCFPAPRPT